MIRRVLKAGHRRRCSTTGILVAVLLSSSVVARAASPEDAYVAARDRDIAFLVTMDAKDVAAQDAQGETDLKDLEQRLKTIVGPVAVSGFSAQGKINIGSLSSRDEGFGTLDGLVYGEGDKSVIVTTDGLLDRWLIGHRHWWSKDNLPPTRASAAKTGDFYTQAVDTDAAIVALADIPVAAPAGTTFVVAILSARTQDDTPSIPDEIFVTIEHGGRVFVVNEKLAVPMKPILACDKAKAAFSRKAEAADARAGKDSRRKRKLMNDADKLRADGDAAFRACFASEVKRTPAFKAATDQTAAVVAAFTR